MTTNELRVLQIIWIWGGEASLDTISREAKISINYARALCQSLTREGCIDFLHLKLCKLNSKGRLMVAGRKAQTPQKIVISRNEGNFGLGRGKRGRLVLNYG